MARLCLSGTSSTHRDTITRDAAFAHVSLQPDAALCGGLVRHMRQGLRSANSCFTARSSRVPTERGVKDRRKDRSQKPSWLNPSMPTGFQRGSRSEVCTSSSASLRLTARVPDANAAAQRYGFAFDLAKCPHARPRYTEVVPHDVSGPPCNCDPAGLACRVPFWRCGCRERATAAGYRLAQRTLNGRLVWWWLERRQALSYKDGVLQRLQRRPASAH